MVQTLSTQTGYHQLAVRLNKFPQGAPPSQDLYKILAMLFSEREARLVSLLPIRVFNAQGAARAWKMNLSQTRKILNQLSRRALLVDIEQNGEMAYVLPPPMAGFFEFSLMSKRNDIDQKELARRFHRYINMEEDFAQALFARGRTPLGRAFVNESQVPSAFQIQVLDYERTSHVIDSADTIGVSQCYCRHKMAHLNQACDAPRGICLTLNYTAASLTRHGHARRIDVNEALDLIETAKGHHLVQFGENVRSKVNFICNCCKCCCEGMQAARRFAMSHPVQTTHFLPTVTREACDGCGQCQHVCPVEAICLSKTKDQKRHARVNRHLCLGCGVCAQVCPSKAIALKFRSEQVVTPINTAHRVVLMALERGTLQHIIFDNQVLCSHKALATLLGVILKLPMVKKIVAAKLLHSRYIESLLHRFKWQPPVSTATCIGGELDYRT